MLTNLHLDLLKANWQTKPQKLPQQEHRISPSAFLSMAQSRVQNGGEVEIFERGKPRTWLTGSDQETWKLLTLSNDKLIIIRQVQDRPEYQALVERLQSNLGGLVTINLYLNTDHNSGFPQHYDPHDLLIAQVYGSKQWWTAPPTKHQPTRFKPEHQRIEFSSAKILDQGDLLYIPWGWWHRAVPKTPSIHMSIGIRDVPFFRLKSTANPRRS